MFSNSISTTNQVEQQHRLNLSNLNKLKGDIAPLAGAAQSLARNALEIRVFLLTIKGDAAKRLISVDGGTTSTHELAKRLNHSANALKSFAAKADSLNNELAYFDKHQQGLMQGNMRFVPVHQKVSFCTNKLDTLMIRASKLGANEGPRVAAAVSDLQRVSRFNSGILRNLDRTSGSTDPAMLDFNLGAKVNKLDHGFH